MFGKLVLAAIGCLAFAVFANRAVTNMWSFILARWARLSNAIIAAQSR